MSLDLPIWSLIITLALIMAVPVYHIIRGRLARREAARLSLALSTSHAIFAALEHVPDNLLQRDLRRGLVLLLNAHLDILEHYNPTHPHLRAMRNRVLTLNKIPSGLKRTALRSKQARRHATLALEELAGMLKEGIHTNLLDRHDGALAQASAQFTAQQIAIDSARQAAKDAENVRAYTHALNFAHQALALCRKLPPLMGKAMTDAVSQDIERLESLVRRAA